MKKTSKTGFKPSLEIVLIGVLSLKLIATAGFLLFFSPEENPTAFVAAAHAQEQAGQPTPVAQAEPQAPGTAPPPRPVTSEALKLKKKALEKREARLREKEKALNLLEKQIESRLAEIEETRRKLAELVKRQEELVEEQKVQRNARIEHLVAAYKGMRPEMAANLVDSMEDGVAVDILSAMPGRNAGQILAHVNPKKAARLTKAIALRRSNQSGGPAQTQPPNPAQTPSKGPEGALSKGAQTPAQ
jgi:flagellar motility protein MotE (MotC chaperone)